MSSVELLVSSRRIHKNMTPPEYATFFATMQSPRSDGNVLGQGLV